VTKDADFSHRVLASATGPKVIHLRIGKARLVRIYLDRIELIA